jgi:serine/threonine protein kinase
MKGSLIGRGTFGDVYLGLNPFSGELMAVKQVELPVENSASVERKRSMVSPKSFPFYFFIFVLKSPHFFL